ncbi:MAG: hypothetical protein JNM63_11790 [Spirochaetia bacterium]|nr:hypothetical protein [Spirochaetia bacterium]
MNGHFFEKALIGALLASMSTASAVDFVGNAASIELRTDGGKTLPLYPLSQSGVKIKSYAEALKGEKYKIVIHNRLNRRIGVVLAVDGRNIISGKKSWLKPNEGMYVQEPFQTCEYEGWRTSMEQVNRFYFTQAEDSYAAAFKDESAMGVIAAAIYPEVIRQKEIRKLSGAPSANSRGESEKSSRSASAEARAGTGYGPEAYSPVTYVSFEAEQTAVETIFLKYEWRSTLVKLGVVPAEIPVVIKNRFWDMEFAPPPPKS